MVSVPTYYPEDGTSGNIGKYVDGKCDPAVEVKERKGEDEDRYRIVEQVLPVTVYQW